MPVKFRLEGDVGVVTLASPERRNALSREIVRGVLDTLRSTEAAAARALVITGDGKAFCAGANIDDLLEAGWIEGRAAEPDPIDLFEAIGRDSRVVIAAVGGMALGGGFELMLSCDLAVAAEDAVFALPETGLGVIPNTALSRLGRLVGPRLTLELAATGRRLSGAEASALGLVSQVVPVGEAEQAAVTMAAALVRRVPPGALTALKRGVADAFPDDWARTRRALQRLPQAEWQEGLAAFMGRRTPDYEQFWSDDAHRRSVQDI